MAIVDQREKGAVTVHSVYTVLDESVQREVAARKRVGLGPVCDIEGERGCGEISIKVALSIERGCTSQTSYAAIS